MLVIPWGFIETALLWQLASLATTPSISVVPLVATLLIANVAHAVLALRYFFLAPVMFDCVIAVMLVLALFK